MKRINWAIRIDPAIKQAVGIYSKLENKQMAEIIEDAIIEYLARHNGKNVLSMAEYNHGEK